MAFQMRRHSSPAFQSPSLTTSRSQMMVSASLYSCLRVLEASLICGWRMLLYASLVMGILAQTGNETSTLEVGRAVERELAGGQTHHYQLSLASGQFLHLVVEQKGIDVALTLFGPDGKKLLEMDSPNGTQGPERILYLAETSGLHRLTVQALEKDARPGRYEAKVAELRAATAQDKSRVLAARAVAEGELLRAQGNTTSLRQAIEKYQAALASLREAGDQQQEAITLSNLARMYDQLGEPQSALDYYQQALKLERAMGNRYGEALALVNMGVVHHTQGRLRQALELYEQALPLMEATESRRLKAVTLARLGGIYDLLDEKAKALDYSGQALTLWRALGDPLGEGTTLNSIGVIYYTMDEAQKALDHYQQALPLLRRASDRSEEAITLSNIGIVYAFLDEQQTALDYYQQALRLHRALGNRAGEAVVLARLGKSYDLMGQKQEALDSYHQALRLHVAVGDRHEEAQTLNLIGDIHRLRGELRQSLEQYQKALPIHRDIGNRRGEATTLNGLGLVYAALGNHEQALESYQQALQLRRNAGDREGEAYTLFNLAHLKRERGQLDEARSLAETAISLLERVRAQVTHPELRASYFATAQQHYGFYIDLLMRLDWQRPTEGWAVAAFEASERARARSLLELLTEARTDIRQGVDASLLGRERALSRLLMAKAEQQLALLSSKHTPAQEAALAEEIRSLTAEYQQVQSRMRETSPRYAALTEPQPAALAEIQRRVLDPDTILLEYACGEEQSWLMVATQETLQAFELPPRARIESLARRVYDLLTARQNLFSKNGLPDQKLIAQKEAEYWQAAAELGRGILSPAASLLNKKRLLIVADGSLQYIPFAALPVSVVGGQGSVVGEKKTMDNGPRGADQDQPLLARYEVVNLPSASVLALMRQELAGRSLALKAVAVLADPVFDRDDPRIEKREGANTSAPMPTARRGVERDSKQAGVAPAGLRIVRLPFSRQEAAAILSLVPANERLEALDFEANRGMVTGGELSRYRIVHFATHGLVNNQHPALSGLMLSLVDRQGKSQDGFLGFNDIYNLRLPAELVVLSACQTGLGKQLRGEGFMGLTRGFMHAGAKRVVASLWKVDDRATAELMQRFYEGMLGPQRLAPAAALRAAQLALLKQNRWHSPYFWAAFVLQGEWK